MTTTPRIETELTSSRMASTAAPSPPSLSPRPTQRPAAIAPASVTRTSSRARLRSGASRLDGVMAVILPLADQPLGAGILAVVTTEPQPAPKPAKPRLLQDGRDMFWSIAPLVAACIVLAGLLGCARSRPAVPARARRPATTRPPHCRPTPTRLRIPIRLPVLPDGWHANSGSRGGIDGGRTDPSGQPRARGVLDRRLPGADRDVSGLDPEQRRRGEADRLHRLRPGADRHAGCQRRAVGGLRRRRRCGAGVDDPADRPDRAGADRDHGRRRYR